MLTSGVCSSIVGFEASRCMPHRCMARQAPTDGPDLSTQDESGAWYFDSLLGRMEQGRASN
jgi:hypothetical protein